MGIHVRSSFPRTNGLGHPAVPTGLVAIRPSWRRDAGRSITDKSLRGENDLARQAVIQAIQDRSTDFSKAG